MEKEHTPEVLNDLVATCRDSEEGFGKAAKGVHSDELRNRLTSYASERARFAEELSAEVRRLGGTPAGGHFGGILHRGWVDLEQSIRPKDDTTFLQQCEDGELGTVNHYRHALDQELPPDTLAIVERQHRSIQRTVEELRSARTVVQTK